MRCAGCGHWLKKHCAGPSPVKHTSIHTPRKLLERRGVWLYKSWSRRTMNLQCAHSPTPAVTHCNKPPPVFPWQSWSQRIESSDGKYKSVPTASHFYHLPCAVCVCAQTRLLIRKYCKRCNPSPAAHSVSIHALYVAWNFVQYSEGLRLPSLCSE